jgi:hypothetical protein
MPHTGGDARHIQRSDCCVSLPAPKLVHRRIGQPRHARCVFALENEFIFGGPELDRRIEVFAECAPRRRGRMAEANSARPDVRSHASPHTRHELTECGFIRNPPASRERSRTRPTHP